MQIVNGLEFMKVLDVNGRRLLPFGRALFAIATRLARTEPERYLVSTTVDAECKIKNRIAEMSPSGPGHLEEPQKLELKRVLLNQTKASQLASPKI